MENTDHNKLLEDCLNSNIDVSELINLMASIEEQAKSDMLKKDENDQDVASESFQQANYQNAEVSSQLCDPQNTNLLTENKLKDNETKQLHIVTSLNSNTSNQILGAPLLFLPPQYNKIQSDSASSQDMGIRVLNQQQTTSGKQILESNLSTPTNPTFSLEQRPMSITQRFLLVSTTSAASSKFQKTAKRFKITSDELQLQCQTFLNGVLSFSNKLNVVKNLKNHIQELIDSRISSEEFLKHLRLSINVHHRRSLTKFLNTSIPLIRQALIKGEVFIKGINPPPVTKVAKNATTMYLFQSKPIDLGFQLSSTTPQEQLRPIVPSALCVTSNYCQGSLRPVLVPSGVRPMVRQIRTAHPSTSQTRPIVSNDLRFVTNYRQGVPKTVLLSLGGRTLVGNLTRLANPSTSQVQLNPVVSSALRLAFNYSQGTPNTVLVPPELRPMVKPIRIVDPTTPRPIVSPAFRFASKCRPETPKDVLAPPEVLPLKQSSMVQQIRGVRQPATTSNLNMQVQPRPSHLVPTSQIRFVLSSNVPPKLVRTSAPSQKQEIPSSSLNIPIPVMPKLPNPSSILKNASKNEDESMVVSNTNIEHINDVTIMGGVNLAEETRLMLNFMNSVGTEERTCEETYLLNIPRLHIRIHSTLAAKGLKKFDREIAELISHALEERLKNFLEDLAVLSGERLKCMANMYLNKTKANEDLEVFDNEKSDDRDFEAEEVPSTEEASGLDEDLNFNSGEASNFGNSSLDLYLSKGIKTVELDDLVFILKRNREYRKDRPYIWRLASKLKATFLYN